MTKDKLYRIIEAADVICGECWGVEEDCHNCKVRLICDYARKEYADNAADEKESNE